jgi:hypothetical protein
MKRISMGGSQRLALDKETLRTLGDADLRDAVGGIPTVTSMSPVGSVILSLATTTVISISTIVSLTCPEPPEEPEEPEEPEAPDPGPGGGGGGPRRP